MTSSPHSLIKCAPQYGGQCALAMANGKKSKGSAEAWTIHAGKICLNYDVKVRGRWRKGMEFNITQANGWWSVIKDK